MSEPQTLADRVKLLTDAHNAEFTRTTREDGTVVVVLHFPLGDKVAAAGGTTADAVAALEHRVAAFMAALGGAA